jgi:hypothetical protein
MVNESGSESCPITDLRVSGSASSVGVLENTRDDRSSIVNYVLDNRGGQTTIILSENVNITGDCWNTTTNIDLLADYPALPEYLFIPIFYQTGKRMNSIYR